MASKTSIYQDIASRTGGDIYIGVIGPVRTGKSTFIKRFMEEVVLPQMEEGPEKSRATDDVPQSGSGKNVMTTQPKFVPEKGVRIQTDENFGFQVKLVDCVGFPVPGAGGLEEDGKSRMVNTPWSQDPIPFEEAASLGTRKVIEEHATVAVVVTTDGSFGEISREAYIKAEEEAILGAKKTGKPFVVVLNTTHPESPETIGLCNTLSEKYKVCVLPLNLFTLEEEGFRLVISKIVLEFPIREIALGLPGWITGTPYGKDLKDQILSLWDKDLGNMRKTGQILDKIEAWGQNDCFDQVKILNSDLGTGKIRLEAVIKKDIFYQILTEGSGLSVNDEKTLMETFCSLSALKEKYDKISVALEQVSETGYGIVAPSLEDLTLEEPEIVKQPGGYGVKLKASAPSIHMMRANIQAEISPIVGSERQSEDIVRFLLKEFEEDPQKIWQSNMFGKSLYELVNEGLMSKLNHMPEEARGKLCETLQKIINEGSGGLICIIL